MGEVTTRTPFRLLLEPAAQASIHQRIRDRENLEYFRYCSDTHLRRLPANWLSQTHLVEIEIGMFPLAIEHSSRAMTAQIHYKWLFTTTDFRRIPPHFATTFLVADSEMLASRVIYE